MAEETNVVTQLNKAYNQFNLLEMRLNPNDLLERVKRYLTGEIESYGMSEKDGTMVRTVMSSGFPKANKRGVATILNWVEMVVNPHVVQGNFPLRKNRECPMYDQYIYECQVDLMDFLMINLYEFDIDEDEVQGVVDSLMNLIKPFMTRLIGNKERESYGETFKQVESTSLSDRRKGVPTFSS